jgi:hypothetical protein
MALFSPEERDYYWWRCEELTCPRRGEPPAYLPLLKVHLKVLFEKAAAELERVGGLSAIQQEQYRAKLASIFRDKTVNLTSLNIKSLQCAALFTEILELQGKLPDPGFSKYRGGTGPIDLYKQIKKKPSVLYTFEGMKAYIKSTGDDWNYFLNDEEEGGAVCCPNLRNKNVCVLLGELTVEEIVRTFAKHIYICGLTFDMAYADGFHYPPLLFLHHDYVHANNRRRQVSEGSPIGYRRLEQFVDYLDSPNPLNQREKNACFLILFMTSHESGREEPYKRLPLLQLVGEGYVAWDGPRWRNKNDLGGLLVWYMGEGSADTVMAAPDGTIRSVLEEAGAILSEKWNAFFAAEGAADPEPSARLSRGPGPGLGAFNARLEGNAAAWNALGFAPAVVKDPSDTIHGLQEGDRVLILFRKKLKGSGRIESIRPRGPDQKTVVIKRDTGESDTYNFMISYWSDFELQRDTRSEAEVLASIEEEKRRKAAEEKVMKNLIEKAAKEANALEKLEQQRMEEITSGDPIPFDYIFRLLNQRVYANVIIETYGNGYTEKILKGTLRYNPRTDTAYFEDEFDGTPDFADDPPKIWEIPREGGGRRKPRRARKTKKRSVKSQRVNKLRGCRKTKQKRVGVRGGKLCS